MSDSKAPPGQIWVCAACGKTSTDNMNDWRGGWDESCFMKSILCYENSLVRTPGGRVIEAKAVEIENIKLEVDL